MGTWGTGLYSNDLSLDVRDTYKNQLERIKTNEEAFEATCEMYKECMGTDEEPLFWYALADMQWRYGKLMPQVKEKALWWIAQGGGTDEWKEKKSDLRQWLKTLEKLKTKLESEQPQERIFKRRKLRYENPWGMNDVYAYQIEDKRRMDERGQEVNNKYILVQKIGETEGRHYGNTIMRVQVYDKVFDELPTKDEALKTIRNCRVLPVCGSPEYTWESYKILILGLSEKLFRHYHPIIMSIAFDDEYGMQIYPKDRLTYICTAEGKLNKQYEREELNTAWFMFDENVVDMLYLWKDVEYEDFGDGTFEYPTTAQKEQIKRDISEGKKNLRDI